MDWSGRCSRVEIWQDEGRSCVAALYVSCVFMVL